MEITNSSKPLISSTFSETLNCEPNTNSLTNPSDSPPLGTSIRLMATQVNDVQNDGNQQSCLKSRFRGCLLGVHVGDVLGSPFEGDRFVSKGELIRFLNTMIFPKHPNRLQAFPFTDDTCMTHSLAESLINHEDFNGADMAKRFTEGYFQNPKRGYGSNIADVFTGLHFEEYQDPFGPARRQFSGMGSYGNGAAMRIAPAALFGYNLSNEKLSELADKCSRITHSNVKGVNGAILQCHAIRNALQWQGIFDERVYITQLLEIAKKLESNVDDRDKIYSPALQEMSQIIEGSHRIGDPSSKQIADIFGNSVSAMKSVPSAIYSAVRAHKPLSSFSSDSPFVRVLYLSISLGGDTDTIASMACAIVGALHGEKIIPETLKKQCESYQVSINLADKLFDIVTANLKA